jgi:hypothetical protein
METQSVPEAAGIKHGGSTSGEFGFFALMAAVLVAVVWVGVLSFEEGMNTEKSKRNGEAWVAWLTDNGTKRFEDGYALTACAGGAAAAAAAAATEPTEATQQAPAAEGEPTAKAAPAAPVPNTWGACLENILKVTELKDLVNPFTGKPPELIEKCDPADHNLHGNISIEKSVANPVGSAVPVTISSLIAADAIDTKLQLKLSICDKGAYPIKVSEFEF